MFCNWMNLANEIGILFEHRKRVWMEKYSGVSGLVIRHDICFQMLLAILSIATVGGLVLRVVSYRSVCQPCDGSGIEAWSCPLPVVRAGRAVPLWQMRRSRAVSFIAFSWYVWKKLATQLLVWVTMGLFTFIVTITIVGVSIQSPVPDLCVVWICFG